MASENIDPESLRKLAEGFEKLNELMGKQVQLQEDKNKQDELYRKKTEDRTKTVTDEIVKRQDLIDSLEKSTKAEDRQRAAVLKGEQAYDQHMRSLGMVKNELGEFQKVTAELTSEQRKQMTAATRNSAISEMIEKGKANKTGMILNGIAATGKFINSTLMDSTKGQGKYGEALDTLGSKVKDLGQYFGPFGQSVLWVTGSLIQLAGAALKHNEAMNKAYENLSEVGQVDVKGIPQLFKNLQNAGMVMAELDKFQSIMKGASEGLTYLGMTAASGAKNVTEIYGKTLNTEAERQLKRLGYTNESAFKTFVNYNTYLAKLGLTQGKSQTELSKGSFEYAKTLDELTKLTGVQRDELQERMRRNAEDVKFRLALENSTPAVRKNLEKLGILAQEGGEDFAAGMRELMANNGDVVGEASAKIAMLTDGASKQIIVNLKAGKINAEEANRQILLAAAARKRQFKDMTFSAETLAQYGLTAKMMDNINRELARTAEGYADLSQDQRDQMEADLDAQRSAEVQRQITERNAEQSKDRFLQLVGKGLAPAFEKLMEIVNRLGKALATFVKFITFGKVDMTDLYDSPQDKIRKRQDEIRDLEAKKEHAGYNGQGGYDESQRALEQADLEKQIQAKKEEIARMKREMGIENNQAAIDKAQAEVKMNEARIRAEKELTLKQMNLTEDRLDKASEADKKAFADQLAKNHKEWTIQLDKSREKLLEEMKKSDEAIAEGFNANRSGGGASTPFNGSSKEFYDKMYNTLLEKAKKAGVENPEAIARLGAAQSALETGYGKKTAGGNNFFGIKAKPGDANAVLSNTQEWDAAKGRYVTVQAGFRKYNSMDESAEDYIKFLQENQRYKEVLGSRTAEQAIAAQGRTGYATDPSYSRKLAEIHSRGTAPGAASGGIFSGPPNGYPVMLHGNEMVIPMPNREALAAITQVNRKPLPEGSEIGSRGQGIDLTPFIKLMSEKFDELIRQARDTHSTQEELLRHARN